MQHRDQDDERDREERVEVKRNALDKERDPVFFTRYKARYRSRPGRNWCDDADRRRRRVDQISQLCAGDLELVRYRTHNTADSEAVEIVVDKDQNTQADRRQLRANAVLDLRLRPAAKRRRRTGFVHQRDNNP